MSVWYCVPSGRPLAEVRPVMEAWRNMGYGVALWRDELPGNILFPFCPPHLIGDFEVEVRAYPGYAEAVNQLSRKVLLLDPLCDWIVTGGDDTLPDPKIPAGEIAEQCSEHFAGTFGVMQCTGDRFAGGSIDRIAGSPWIGREWCRRANQGKGPFWPEFTHMFVDDDLQSYAEHLGVFWQRPDLVHLHKHFMRESDAIDANALARTPPPHLTKWNTRQHWDEMKAICEHWRAVNYIGREPLGRERR